MDPKTTSLGNITPEDLAKYLSAAYGLKFNVDEIEADIALGAPVNPDGTMHLIDYMAWMIKERRSGREGRPAQPPSLRRVEDPQLGEAGRGHDGPPAPG